MYQRIIIFLLCFNSWSQNEDLKIIGWNENRPLNWSDFEDKPISNSSAAALTASGITFSYSIEKEEDEIVDFRTEVTCLFYPEKSWVKLNLANDYILKHEQLHFNITELHARKFRKAISELKVSSKLKNKLNNLYDTINKASSEMQKRYDAETNHSINKEEQEKWHLYITSELEILEDFKSS